MAINRFFTNQLVVRKLKAVSGYRKRYRATATVEGHVQRADEEKIMAMGGVYGQTYVGWLPIDLDYIPQPNDQITDDKGRIFVVKTVEPWDFGINQHWELIMDRWNPQDRE